MTPNIAVLAGSLREGSYNRTLAALAARQLREHGGAVTEVDLAEYELPIYRHEIEESAFPPAALALKRLFQAQDALVIVSPEYNGSIPPLLKNALDWASRPTDGEGLTALTAYRGKAAAIASASIGPFGGLRALTHLRQILSTMQMLVIPEQVMVPLAGSAFDDDGSLGEALPAMLLDALAKRLVLVAAGNSARD
ncbi:MAG: NADPH-dependent FMN reductase [Tsuneonella sp.]